MKIRASTVAAVLFAPCAVCAAAEEAPPPAASPAEAPAAAAPAKGAPVTSIAPARAPEGSKGSVVRFKNGSVMPCTIVREGPTGVTVESYGVQFEVARDEIDYYGDASKCPGLAPGEVVAEETQEAAGKPQPAVDAAAPKPAAQPTATREERFRTHSRTAPAAPAPAKPAPQISLPDIEENPARFQGQKLVFTKVKLGALNHLEGFYAIELLPPQTQRGGKHRGGSSTDLTARGVTFILTEQQAKDLQEHSKQYDFARIEFAIEQRTVGNVRYWVAPISKLDVFSGDSNEIAWTMW